MTASSPEDRVQQFWADYYEQWQQHQHLFADDDDSNGLSFTDKFDVWKAAMAHVEERQLAEQNSFRLGGSFSNPGEFAPDKERVQSVVDEPDRTVVQTTEVESPDTFHDYELVQQGEDWRLIAETTYFEDPESVYLGEDEISAVAALSQPDAPLGPLSRSETAVDPTSLFIEREMTVDDDSGPVTVHSLGNLDLPSGVISVQDLGYDIDDDTLPLARTVPPGSYPVQVSRAFGRNAAVRVLFGDAEPTAWHPASVTGDGGHVMGVDYANLCIADYPSLARLTRRRKERAYRAFADAGVDDVALPFEVGSDSTAVVVASGWGDGGYPVYWGVGADQTVQQLVIDFMVLTRLDSDDD